jgi:formyl-CoA transferase
MTDGPLHGVRVLEFSLIIAGPFLGMNLADLGADVIKVEPPEGELRRHNGVVPGTSKQFQWVNRGKRSLQLDLTQQAARDVVYRMIKDIDVVVTNYRPGVPGRLGIDYDTLAKLKPDLIYVNISAFGPEGPLANDGAADIAAQAYSGAMAANGKLDEVGAPEPIGGIVLADAAGGLGGAMGVCAALFHRERTGEGQLLESSLVHSAMALAGMNTMREETTDRQQRDPIIRKYAEIRARGGSYADLIESRSPSGRGPIRRRGANYWAGYNASDGALVFSGNTVPGRRAIRSVLGFEGAGDDDPALNVDAPDFEGLVLRERDEIRRLIRERTVGEWIQAFRAAGAPVAPVLLPEEVADDEQGSYYFQDLVHPVTGAERQVKPIVSFSKSPSRIRFPADMLGEHADEILGEFHFPAEEIAQARAAGVFG